MVRAVSCGSPERANISEDLDKRAPISVKFEIPYFTVSGIQVRYLKIVEKSGYQSVSDASGLKLALWLTMPQLPWVRYVTQNGDDYVLRTISDAKSSSMIAPL